MIVFTDMVADLFHIGHVKFLESAKAQGDYLIVGIHSDRDVASEKRTPIMNMHERAHVVESCRYVDKIVLDAPYGISEEFLEFHHIDLVVHAHPVEEEELYYPRYKVPISLAKFRRLEYNFGISTSEILARISGSNN